MRSVDGRGTRQEYPEDADVLSANCAPAFSAPLLTYTSYAQLSQTPDCACREKLREEEGAASVNADLECKRRDSLFGRQTNRAKQLKDILRTLIIPAW